MRTQAGRNLVTRRRGFTLLELLLSLALTVLVMVAIGMAISFSMRTLEKRRANIEEAQLARAILKMISDDLRNAVQYQEIDFSQAKQLAQTAIKSMTGQSQGGSSGGANATGGSSGQSSSSTTSTNSTNATNATNSTTTTTASATVPNRPGLYGTSSEIQVDISRLPRVDEYSSLATPTGMDAILDMPSDVKTVSYFVKGSATTPAISPTGGAAPLATTQHVSSGGGLVRRSLSRLIAKQAMENGDLASLENTGEILASEVAGIEFKYFDGTEWVTEWDSEERGGLPIAVEIMLAVQPREDSPTGSQPVMFRLVVRIPVGEPTTLAATSGQTTTQPATQSTTAPASTGAGT